MSTGPIDGPHAERARDRSATYLAVLILEAAVIAALWAFGQYFSA